MRTKTQHDPRKGGGKGRTWQHKGRFVNRLGIILQRHLRRDGPGRRGRVDRRVVGRHDEANLPRRIRRDRRVPVAHAGENLAAFPDHVADEVEVQPQTLALGAHDPPGGQGILHGEEKIGLEKGLGGPDGVGRIADNDVVALVEYTGHVVSGARRRGQGVLAA